MKCCPWNIEMSKALLLARRFTRYTSIYRRSLLIVFYGISRLTRDLDVYLLVDGIFSGEPSTRANVFD